MLWQAQHGATADEYRADCMARGAPVPAYLTMPDALPGVLPWFMAFWELSTDRRFPGGPIPRQSIEAHPVEPAEADDFRDAMREMDSAYLRWLDKPADERKSLPVARSGMLKGRRKE